MAGSGSLLQTCEASVVLVLILAAAVGSALGVVLSLFFGDSSIVLAWTMGGALGIAAASILLVYARRSAASEEPSLIPRTE